MCATIMVRSVVERCLIFFFFTFYFYDHARFFQTYSLQTCHPAMCYCVKGNSSIPVFLPQQKKTCGKPPNEEQISEKMPQTVPENQPSHSFSSARRNSTRGLCSVSEWAGPKQKQRSSFHLLPPYCILDFLPLTKNLSCSSKLLPPF